MRGWSGGGRGGGKRGWGGGGGGDGGGGGENPGCNETLLKPLDYQTDDNRVVKVRWRLLVLLLAESLLTYDANHTGGLSLCPLLFSAQAPLW